MKILLAGLILFLSFPVWAEEGASWWYEQAQILYQEGDREGALALLEEIPRRFPEAKSIQLRASILKAQIYYDRGEYQRVIETLRPLVREAELTPRAYLLLAQAAEKLGLYDESLTFLRYLKRRFSESPEVCAGNLVAARIFLARHLEEKSKRLARRVLSLSNCSLKERSEAVALLIKTGEDPARVLSFLEQNPEARRFAPEILKSIAYFHLQRGDIEKAEKEIFEYLNYSGKEEEAPELLYALGEAYYKARKYREARRILELVLTSWPHKPEALFAKFRLYQLRYLFKEKIGHKSDKTRRLLLGICRLLKKEYPDAPLTEEAHAVEIELLLEEKDLSACLESIWDFLKKYPESTFKPRVFRVLCRASGLYLQGFLAKKEFREAVLFFEAHREELSAAGCGTSFYFAAEAYLGLDLSEEARLVLLDGFVLPVPGAWVSNFRLTLVDLLLSDPEGKDFELAVKILEETPEIYPEITKSPYFHYLRGRILARERRWVEALEELSLARQKASDEELKGRAEEAYLRLLLRLGRYEEAFSILAAQKEPPPVIFKTLALSLLQENRLLLAKEVISALQERFPKDPEIKWLYGLLLEKEGEAQKALSVWQEVAQSEGLYRELASNILKAAQILEASRSEIY
ncbi:MAG: tetratricopeptide repeat protein [Thermodesulfobacteria bacterium]|nr:tetratricopeptide repeat protein [Thermodesulfobacteriota bacterium]